MLLFFPFQALFFFAAPLIAMSMQTLPAGAVAYSGF
jgi:hypothetical protein